MPSYFYNISLEILPQAVSSDLGRSDDFDVASSSSTSADPALVLRAAREALRPFRKRRPKTGKEVRAQTDRAHSSTVGPGESGQGHHWSANTVVNGGGSLHHHKCRAAENQHPLPPTQQQQQQHYDGEWTINSRNTPINHQTPSSSASNSYAEAADPSSALATDPRLDRISFECIDMVPDSDQAQYQQSSHPSGSGSSGNDDQITKGIGTRVLGGLATKGRYVPLDQKVSDSVWGVVHLYRDAEESATLRNNDGGDDDPSFLKGSAIARTSKIDAPGTRTQFGSQDAGSSSTPSSSSISRPPPPSSSSTSHTPASDPADDCSTLCILAVPSYLSPADFLGLVGEETRDEVSHFRMIRTARANRYMVLMKFRSGRKARTWQKEWNGKVFNSMEPETYHVVFVRNVEIQVPEGAGSESRFPDTNNDPFTPTQGQPGTLTTSSLSSKPAPPPTPSLIELPTCPVCLERMDETTGLLTIICQHVFHCTCLQKWKGSGCPVCRYTQDDLGKHGNAGFGFDECSDGPIVCNVCHAEDNLWVCLICGNIGCGRYDGAHAFAHFTQTGHSFAMDLSSQRVWDYVGDGYVHRIIQNKADGKLVELPAADNSALDPPDWADAVPREKWENMSVEYTHLLTSQLESQRTYFEEKVERAADKASKASSAALSAQEAAEKATAQLRDMQEKYEFLVSETIPGLERDKTRAEKRAEKFETMAHRMEKEWREEKTMNSSLLERVEFLDGEAQKLKAENADLSEQNRDLTFFISGMEKMKEHAQDQDVVEGTVSVPEPEASSSKKGRKGKGKGKGKAKG